MQESKDVCLKRSLDCNTTRIAGLLGFNGEGRESRQLYLLFFAEDSGELPSHPCGSVARAIRANIGEKNSEMRAQLPPDLPFWLAA
jgi:hypothetical protein